MIQLRSAGLILAGFVAGVAVTLVYVSFTLPPTAAAPISGAPVSSANTPVVGPTAVPPSTPSTVAESPKGAVATPAASPKTVLPPAGKPGPIVAKSAAITAPRANVSNVDGAGVMQLIIPVEGIRATQLRDTYSDARGAGRRHDAIDIMAAHNTPVLAAAPAVVVKQDHGARGGTALYALAADHRTVYYYAHLDRYAAGVVEGTALRAGDVLGYVGDTGNAGAGNYHLHFEITTTSDPKRYWGGLSHNPFPLLRNGITVK